MLQTEECLFESLQLLMHELLKNPNGDDTGLLSVFRRHACSKICTTQITFVLRLALNIDDAKMEKRSSAEIWGKYYSS